MCKPGQPWDSGYFEWLAHAKVIIVLLSENYFKSNACKREFKQACNCVPDPRVLDKSVIPIVVSELSFKYPNADPNCPADLKAELNQRNCFPDPSQGHLMCDFDNNMAAVVGLVQSVLGHGP